MFRTTIGLVGCVYGELLTNMDLSFSCKKSPAKIHLRARYSATDINTDPNAALDALERVMEMAHSNELVSGFKLFASQANHYPDPFWVYRDCIDPNHDMLVVYLERVNVVHKALSLTKAKALDAWGHKNTTGAKVRLELTTLAQTERAQGEARKLAESLGVDMAVRYVSIQDPSSPSYYRVFRDIWEALRVEASAHTEGSPLKVKLPRQQDPSKIQDSILNLDEVTGAGWTIDYPPDETYFKWAPFEDMSKVKVLS